MDIGELPDYLAELFNPLTYLQFCVQPSFFHRYIEILLEYKKLSTLSDIFILYSQTLFDLIPFPIGEDRQKSELKFLSASAVGEQMLNLLAYLLAAFPKNREQMLYTKNIPSCLYEVLTKKLITQQKWWENNPSVRPSEIQIFKLYYSILGHYFTFLAIEEQIKKRRISSLQQNVIKLEVLERKAYCQSVINQSPHRDRFICTFSRFYEKITNMMEKLKFAFSYAETEDRKNQRQIEDERNIFPKIRGSQQEGFKAQQSDKLSFQTIHISSFYQKCLSQEQKLTLIKVKFQDFLINLAQEQKEMKIRGIQNLCILYLQEVKDQKIIAKLQPYMILGCLKLCQTGTVSTYIEQIKLLFSFEVLPKVEFAFLLLSSLISCPTNTNTNYAQANQLIHYILKIYQKSTNKSYVKLVLMSSLYNSYKIPAIKSPNRKLQLDKLNQYKGIIQFTNNLEIIDYLIQLIWCGKELKFFSQDKGTHSEMSQGPLQALFPLSEAEATLKEYFCKNSASDQNSSTCQSCELPSESLYTILSLLLEKRLMLIKEKNTNELIYCKILQVAVESQSFIKLIKSNSYLKKIGKILQEYYIFNLYNPIHEKAAKVLFTLLYACLIGNNQKKQALICLQLSNKKLNFDKIEATIRSNSQQYGRISKNLFECILYYDIVQILLQNYRGLYEGMAREWISKSENYLYNWPDTRKEKILQSKRNSFLLMITKKLKQK